MILINLTRTKTLKSPNMSVLFPFSHFHDNQTHFKEKSQNSRQNHHDRRHNLNLYNIFFFRSNHSLFNSLHKTNNRSKPPPKLTQTKMFISHSVSVPANYNSSFFFSHTILCHKNVNAFWVSIQLNL